MIGHATVGSLRKRWTEDGAIGPDGKFPRYTSIGCYTLRYYVLPRYDVLCHACVGKEPDDAAIDVETFDEGDDAQCAECGVAIESSYGPVENEGNDGEA